MLQPAHLPDLVPTGRMAHGDRLIGKSAVKVLNRLKPVFRQFLSRVSPTRRLG